MSDDASFDKFKACAIDVLQVPPDKVVLEARFGDDLDADSLDLVELVMALEEAFDVTVDESELEGIETVGQAYDLISAKLRCFSASGRTGPSGDGASSSPAWASWRAAGSASTPFGKASIGRRPTASAG